MRKVSSINLVSTNHGLIYREDLRLSRVCRPLSSANGPDKMSPDALEVVPVVMKK